MVKLAPLFVMRGKGDNRPSTVLLVTHLFKAVEAFKEKDSVNGRSSRRDVF